jgi:hypothetical protein
VTTRPRLLLPFLLRGLASIPAFQQFRPPAARVVGTAGEGSATLTPSTMQVAQIGDYELTFVAGPHGIAKRGALLIAFPKAWFTNPHQPVPIVAVSRLVTDIVTGDQPTSL